jgi:hypothetical protein
MCFRDLLATLRRQGVLVTESQIRWAITSGKVPRPPIDGSLRFDFGETHVKQLREYFEKRDSAATERASRTRM